MNQAPKPNLRFFEFAAFALLGRAFSAPKPLLRKPRDVLPAPVNPLKTRRLFAGFASQLRLGSARIAGCALSTMIISYQ